MVELINRSGAMELDRDLVSFPRNDYTPDFATSLNFNFNTNDIFGARAKKTAAMSLLKSNTNLNLIQIHRYRKQYG